MLFVNIADAKPEKGEVPKIRVGQFQGLYFDNVENEYTSYL